MIPTGPIMIYALIALVSATSFVIMFHLSKKLGA